MCVQVFNELPSCGPRADLPFPLQPKLLDGHRGRPEQSQQTNLSSSLDAHVCSFVIDQPEQHRTLQAVCPKVADICPAKEALSPITTATERLTTSAPCSLCKPAEPPVTCHAAIYQAPPIYPSSSNILPSVIQIVNARPCSPGH
jgi:hypothetical protein